jgi:hypothetical protein
VAGARAQWGLLLDTQMPPTLDPWCCHNRWLYAAAKLPQSRPSWVTLQQQLLPHLFSYCIAARITKGLSTALHDELVGMTCF